MVRQWWWIVWAGVVLTLVIAAFSVSTYLGQGQPFRAALCLMAQLFAIVCAVTARRALVGREPGFAFMFMLAALGCSYWSALGLANAWAAQGEPANWAMVMFLAALEPLFFLGVEQVRERVDQKAAQERAAQAAQEMAQIVAQAAAQEAARAANLHGRVVRSIAEATGHPPARPRIVSGGVVREEREKPAVVSAEGETLPARARFDKLRAAHPGLPLREISRRANVPWSTARRWAQDAHNDVGSPLARTIVGLREA